MNQWDLQHLHRQLEHTMGSVLSTFVQDYNENFSYRTPSHIQMDDSSDEEEQFIIYSRVDVRIVTIDSESESNWRFVKIPRMFSFWRISRAYQTLVDSLSWSNHGSKRNGNQADYDIGKLFLVPKHQGQQELHVHLNSFCTRYGESKQIVLLFLPEQNWKYLWFWGHWFATGKATGCSGSFTCSIYEAGILLLEISFLQW